MMDFEGALRERAERHRYQVFEKRQAETLLAREASGFSEGGADNIALGV